MVQMPGLRGEKMSVMVQCILSRLWEVPGISPFLLSLVLCPTQLHFLSKSSNVGLQLSAKLPLSYCSFIPADFFP